MTDAIMKLNQALENLDNAQSFLMELWDTTVDWDENRVLNPDEYEELSYAINMISIIAIKVNAVRKRRI